MSEVGCPIDTQSLLGKCVARGAQRPLGGTHKGLHCQEGIRIWPGDYVHRRAGADCSSGSFLAAARSCRRAGGVKLERPQPRSGEDERAWRRL